MKRRIFAIALFALVSTSAFSEEAKRIHFQCGSAVQVRLKGTTSTSSLKLCLDKVSDFHWNSDDRGSEIIRTQRNLEALLVFQVDEKGASGKRRLEDLRADVKYGRDLGSRVCRMQSAQGEEVFVSGAEYNHEVWLEAFSLYPAYF